MARPMARPAVAAGEGALTTWTIRSSPANTKSSMRRPSGPTAWARTPLPAGTRSSMRSARGRGAGGRPPSGTCAGSGPLRPTRCASSGGPVARWRGLRPWPPRRPGSRRATGSPRGTGPAPRWARRGPNRPHPGEVGAQEGEAGVGDRVDEVADQVAPVGHELGVLAAERQDPRRRVPACRPRHPVGAEAGAVGHPWPDLGGRVAPVPEARWSG